MQIELDTKSASNLTKALQRYEKVLKKDTPYIMARAGVMLCRSLSAKKAVKIAPKRRKVIKITEKNASKHGLSKEQQYALQSKQFAPYGVKVWRNGKQEYVPIEAKHTRLAIRTVKATGQVLIKNLDTGEMVPENRVHEIDHRSENGANNAPITFIRRSGLAQKSWWWGKRYNAKGTGYAFGIATVQIERPEAGHVFKITNKLGYITDTFKRPLSASINAASRNIHREIKNKLKKM